MKMTTLRQRYETLSDVAELTFFAAGPAPLVGNRFVAGPSLLAAGASLFEALSFAGPDSAACSLFEPSTREQCYIDAAQTVTSHPCS